MRGPDHVDARAVGQAQVNQQHVGRRALQRLQPLRTRAGQAHQADVGRGRDGGHDGVLEVNVVFDKRHMDQRRG